MDRISTRANVHENVSSEESSLQNNGFSYDKRIAHIIIMSLDLDVILFS